jgi:hypothetical protein
MNAINVEIYLTIGHDHHANNVDGYQPGEHLVKVFEYTTAQNGRTITQIADQAYRIGNGVAASDEDHQLRCAYEGFLLRAVGVGDVVITGGVALACTSTGWRPITLATTRRAAERGPGRTAMGPGNQARHQVLVARGERQ